MKRYTKTEKINSFKVLKFIQTHFYFQKIYVAADLQLRTKLRDWCAQLLKSLGTTALQDRSIIIYRSIKYYRFVYAWFDGLLRDGIFSVGFKFGMITFFDSILFLIIWIRIRNQIFFYQTKIRPDPDLSIKRPVPAGTGSWTW